jgi:hypothetical protein
MRGRAARPVADRLWEKVRRGGVDECWPWIATTTHWFGYGRLEIKGKIFAAHRISYELANGPIPDGLFVLHRCDNPPCVNPHHLFLGTQKDNIGDASAKGRMRGWCAAKTHCIHGHALSGDNLGITPSNGKRYCKTCKRRTDGARRLSSKARTWV